MGRAEDKELLDILNAIGYGRAGRIGVIYASRILSRPLTEKVRRDRLRPVFSGAWPAAERPYIFSGQSRGLRKRRRAAWGRVRWA
jgi:hypothetical protein